MNTNVLENVQVTTLTVEIKALKIGNKQVTQSVFKQLEMKEYLNRHTGQKNGTLWGWVNYFWGDCYQNHIHVVWQKGKTIYRDCLYPGGLSVRALQNDIRECLIAEKILRGLSDSVWWEANNDTAHMHVVDSSIRSAWGALWRLDYQSRNDNDGRYPRELEEKYANKLKQWVVEAGQCFGIDGSIGSFNVIESEKKIAIQNLAELWNAEYKAAEASTHLFISV